MVEAATRTGTHRILVVDDEGDVRHGLARAITRLTGYESATAANAFEAGYQLAHFRPDLAILDIMMPGMNGLEICGELRRIASSDEVKVIVLTGYPGGGNKEITVLQGADLLLEKPQDVETLIRHIDDLLGE